MRGEMVVNGQKGQSPCDSACGIPGIMMRLFKVGQFLKVEQSHLQPANVSLTVLLLTAVSQSQSQSVRQSVSQLVSQSRTVRLCPTFNY